MKENKKGISLIVLVITIIVMIILAATVIISLTGNSVIDRAGEAVDATNAANVQQLASTLWADAYLDGARTQSEFKTAIEDGLVKAGINPNEYAIIVTTSGVTATKGWAKDGFTVVKGDKVLEIGDIVNYDETSGNTKTVSVDTEWKVLGADEDGNLLLLSTKLVGSHTLGSDSDLKESQNDWLNGVSELNAICEPYGFGKGVVGKARSLTADDVDSVTGYDKTTYVDVASIGKYGNEVTYSYNGTVYPNYTSAAMSGKLGRSYSAGLYYYDGKEFKVENDITSKSSGIITTVINNYYTYNPAQLTTISATENAKAYETVFPNGGDLFYGGEDMSCWLATPTVHTSVVDFTCGMFAMSNLVIGSEQSCDMWPVNSLWDSQGNSRAFEYGVRAVVSLSSDIAFTWNETTNSWNY